MVCERRRKGRSRTRRPFTAGKPLVPRMHLQSVCVCEPSGPRTIPLLQLRRKNPVTFRISLLVIRELCDTALRHSRGDVENILNNRREKSAISEREQDDEQEERQGERRGRKRRGKEERGQRERTEKEGKRKKRRKTRASQKPTNI